MNETKNQENERLKKELSETLENLRQQRDMMFYQIVTWFCLGITFTCVFLLPLANFIKDLM